MTVAIGLVCKDGVIVASDSMGSTATGLSTSMTKIYAFENNPVVWTAAGAVYTKEDVHASLIAHVDDQERAWFTAPNLGLLRTKIHSDVHKAMEKCYLSALSVAPHPPGAVTKGVAAEFLFLGFAQAKPWFLEVGQTGEANWHTVEAFAAIGSGGPFATVCHALMKHYAGKDLTLDEGLRVAYRAIATTCEVSSGLVGLPVQLAVVDAGGARVLDDDEVRKISLSVGRWMALERDTLRGVDGQAEPEGDLPSMAPEAGATS